MVTATVRKATDAPAATGPVIDVESQVVPEGATEAALFGDDKQPGTPTTAVVPVAAQPVAPTRYVSEVDEDGFGREDMKFPTLKVVAGSGKLSQKFNQGALVFGSSFEELECIAEPPPAGGVGKVLRFIPVNLHKHFRESLTQDQMDAGEMPRNADTVEEVEALGGTTQWVGDTKPSNYWDPAARCLILLEQPEGCQNPLFCIPLDGKLYSPAVLYVAKSSYRAFAIPIYNTARTIMMEPVLGADGQVIKNAQGYPVKRKKWHKFIWTLNVAKRPSGKYMVFVPEPKVQTKELTGPEASAYCDSITASAPKQSEA